MENLQEIWQVRIQSLMFDVGGMLLAAIIGVFTSDVFFSLLTQYFGTTALGATLVLVLVNALKHFRNTRLQGTLGTLGEKPQYI